MKKRNLFTFLAILFLIGVVLYELTLIFGKETVIQGVVFLVIGTIAISAMMANINEPQVREILELEES